MSLILLRRRLLLTFLLGFLVTPLMLSVAYAADIAVFAAASLKNALDDVAKAYESKTGDKIVISYAASSALAKQIEGGAPADIFFSADLDWMDYLEKKNLIDDVCSPLVADLPRLRGFVSENQVAKSEWSIGSLYRFGLSNSWSAFMSALGH
jgi:ABC-type molybdate transport system substrate-binding protein